MLGIDVFSFSRCDLKKIGIEAIHLIEEAPPTDMRLSLKHGLQSIKLPSIRGHLPNRIGSLVEHPPKQIRIVSSSWKAAADTYNRNRIHSFILDRY